MGGYSMSEPTLIYLLAWIAAGSFEASGAPAVVVVLVDLLLFELLPHPLAVRASTTTSTGVHRNIFRIIGS